jgi:hypothetical protein
VVQRSTARVALPSRCRSSSFVNSFLKSVVSGFSAQRSTAYLPFTHDRCRTPKRVSDPLPRPDLLARLGDLGWRAQPSCPLHLRSALPRFLRTPFQSFSRSRFYRYREDLDAESRLLQALDLKFLGGQRPSWPQVMSGIRAVAPSPMRFEGSRGDC